MATATLSRRPQRGWLKLVLTSGRPGSKHSGVSMETQQRRTRWGLGMGRVASAWCGSGELEVTCRGGAQPQDSSQGKEGVL